MKVLLVGSNPSASCADKTAFNKTCRSRSVIDRWFKDIDVELHFCNVSDTSTPGNRPLKTSEIRENVPSLLLKVEGYDKIVGLGGTACRALSIAGIKHFTGQHPSGMNRNLNDPVFVENMIKSLKEYVHACK